MKKHKERNIEIFAWFLTSFLLFIFIPKSRIREAQVSFHFKQVITWIFGLLVVEKDLIRYPYRLFFKKANKSSFTFEYFVYPSFCALFNLHYPKQKSLFLKGLYYFFFTSIITGFEIYAVKYTQLIKYKRWAWYWSFITMWFSYYFSRLYYKWFFKNSALKKGER